jgi:seryl-tRNA synthetase
MIDLIFAREFPQQVIKALRRKDPQFDIDRLLVLDEQYRSLNVEVESLRAQKNDLAQKAKSGVTQEIREQSVHLSKQLKEKEALVQKIHQEFMELYLYCPNVPFDEIPDGGKEANKVVREWGKKPEFSFDIKNHVELAQINQWFDMEVAARMTGSQFVFYKEMGAKVIYALTMLMLKNNIKHGFTPFIPPFLVNEKALETASNFPRFKPDVYSVENGALYLTPTAEVNLTNVYRDSILMADQLPVRMTAWTSCFRSEAGGYGAQERGLIRIHQFEKVEIYSICEPEKSLDELESMVSCAEQILQALGLHYRVSLLAAQDMSFASAKTYDIEVWMPGQGRYYEVSSCSNCTDFQSRRGSIRYKKSQNDKTKFVHTLNASSLALPRLMVAIMETYQQPDGTIRLPECLKGLGLF